MKRPVTTSVRCSRSIGYLLLMLGVLVIADAHIATALAGDHAIVEPTCGASLPTLTRDASPAVLQRLKPISSTSSTVSQSPSPLLHGPVLSPSTFEPSLLPNEHWPQDPLHALVHVFLF
jgi:hypothetical protein